MNIKKAEKLWCEAKVIALDLPPDSNRHISFIFDRKKLISIGANYGKSSTACERLGYYNMVPHSELRAFLKVPYTLRSDLTLVNFRFNKRGELRMSKPCRYCQSWCDAVFKHIYYTVDDAIVYWNRRTGQEEFILGK